MVVKKQGKQNKFHLICLILVLYFNPTCSSLAAGHRQGLLPYGIFLLACKKWKLCSVKSQGQPTAPGTTPTKASIKNPSTLGSMANTLWSAEGKQDRAFTCIGSRISRNAIPTEVWNRIHQVVERKIQYLTQECSFNLLKCQQMSPSKAFYLGFREALFFLFFFFKPNHYTFCFLGKVEIKTSNTLPLNQCC